MNEHEKIEVALLNKLIKQIRELRGKAVTSNELNAEQLHYINEGYKQGLCSAALMLADEVDARSIESEQMEKEEMWWQNQNYKS